MPDETRQALPDHRTSQAEGWRKVAVGDARDWKARAENAEAENETLKAERASLRATVRIWLSSPQPERNRLEGIRRALNDPEYALLIARGASDEGGAT